MDSVQEVGTAEDRSSRASRRGFISAGIVGPARGVATWIRARASTPRLIVIAAAILYTIYWANLTVDRFNALQGHIYDLGVTAENAWLVLHSGPNLAAYWGLFSLHGFAYLLSPLEIYPSYPALLWVQAAALASASLAIYGIAAKELDSEVSAACLAVSYLIFFPVSGMNWFDAHLEIFIVPLFLWAYFFYLDHRPWVAYSLFAIAGVSQYPYAGFTALFAVLNLVSLVRVRSRRVAQFANPAYWKFDIALLAVSILALVSGVVYLDVSGSSSSVFLHLSSAGTAATSITADSRLIALLLLFAPFLFLPLLSPRWTLFLVPGVLFILLSSDSYWTYPSLFFTQYSAILVPFIYLGLIDSVRRSVIVFGQLPTRSSPVYRPPRAPLPGPSRAGQAVATAVVVLVAVGMLGTVYDPYGPFNRSAALSYDLPTSVTENATIDSALSRLLGLIPAEEPNLLLQNNLPQAYPRPLGNNGVILITGQTMAYNYTYFYRDRWVPAQIDYVLTDPWDYTFSYQAAYPYNLSMEAAVTQLYHSGSFGILGEAYGLILLERNYSGAPRYYVPESREISASNLFVTVPTYREGGMIVANNVTNQSTIWFGPYTFFLQPGLYNVTYEVRTTDNSSTNRVKLDVYAGNTGPLNSSLLTGPDISLGPGWVAVTTPVYINNFEERVNLAGDDAIWSGKLFLASIRIVQVQAPSPRFVEGIGPRFAVAYQLAAMIPAGSTVVAQPGLGPILASDRYTSSTGFDWNGSSHPAYILGAPAWPDFLSSGGGSALSMLATLRGAVAEYGYGILAEVDGAVLLELGRTAAPELFVGINESISAESLSVVRPEYRAGGMIEAINVTNQTTVWYGPYEYLPPGNYTITYRLLVTNASASNFLDLDVIGGSPLALLKGDRITGSVFPAPSQWTNIAVQISLPSFTPDVEYNGDDVDWHGELALLAIDVVQASPVA